MNSKKIMFEVLQIECIFSSSLLVYRRNNVVHCWAGCTLDNHLFAQPTRKPAKVVDLIGE